MSASDRSADCAPVAALLYQADRLPSLSQVLAGPDSGAGYLVSLAPAEGEGWAEILGNGLTFDLRGLRGGPHAPAPELRSGLGLPLSGAADRRWLTLAPGPHLAGAGHLLPVIRVVAKLLIELAKVGPATAIAWIPAHLVVTTDIFERAVGPWLEGGPFPAPAFVGFHREAGGGLRSEGLNFLMGQEFLIQNSLPVDSAELPKIAFRLVDWLVAHGPVVQPLEANLAGTGTVFLEPDERGRILAKCV